MSQFDIVMPKLGESIQEGTITKWFVKEGDKVEEDDILFEVATDKVDSEIPSPVDGVISKIFFPEDSLVPVGERLAIVLLEGDEGSTSVVEEKVAVEKLPEQEKATTKEVSSVESVVEATGKELRSLSNRFYSPLVKKIASDENISVNELESIEGSGAGGRVQKKDILDYIKDKKAGKVVQVSEPKAPKAASMSVGAGDQIIEMDRVRKLIASHMVHSVQVSPHVTSVVEADVTNLVFWRNKNKDAFLKKYGEKITFMPVFTEAVAQALTEFPLVNSSVDGDRIILKKDINIGIAVANLMATL